MSYLEELIYAMAGLSGLTSESLGSSTKFNWTWFIELITAGILVLWFLFYLNRLFATVVSYGLRTYSWHKFRVYIDIQSLQLSLLGGRIFFKGVRYHGENETVYIHNGHLTWRYWLRVTKQVAISRRDDSATEWDEKTKQHEDSSETSSEPPSRPDNRNQPESRLHVSLTGLEWFIYNRTPVYDAIVQDAGIRASSGSSVHDKSTGDALARTIGAKLKDQAKMPHVLGRKDRTVSIEKLQEKEDYDIPSTRSTSQEEEDLQSVASQAGQPETDVSTFYHFMLRFFPIGIECSKGAISLGNEHTKALIVTTFDKAGGHIDAGSSGPADIYRQIFDFNIEHPVVQMKPNPDFHLPQMAAAERIITGHDAILKRRPWWRPHLNLRDKRRRWSRNMRNLVPYFRRSVSNLHDLHVPKEEDEQKYAAFSEARPDSHDWHGLDRYMDEDEGDDHLAWLGIDYARFATILDCPHVHFNFYWDTPGEVRDEHESATASGLAADLNGISPPGYGMHLDVYGGLVNYGPWSDRLRVELQNEFLPTGYRRASPKEALSPGEARLSTVMNITVIIKKQITLRIPTREGSKDWRWRGRATAVRDAAALRRQQEQRKHFRFRRSNKHRLGPDVRPFGWIAIAAGHDSKVKYVMDMFAGVDGYRNTLQVNLRNTKATSSVNHAMLWDCAEQDVSADLSNPLGWNELHTWRFDIMNRNMDLFLLRDHTFLLLDLISDFTAGQKTDYMTFMPFKYAIGVKFLDFRLLLNANDNNIIDSPNDCEENAFLILAFSRLAGQVEVPMQYFLPAQSSVKFNGNGQEASLILKTPSWHTLHNFGDNENMATLKTLHLDGAYNYYSGTSAQFTDSLFMSIYGGSPKFNLQGYLIRYFMNVKDNYFGDTIHFSTLEEYQARLDRQSRGEEEKQPPPKKENDLDVILSVKTDKAAAVMPSNLYRGDDNVRIDVMLIEADMRFTNYFMDLQVNSSPIEVGLEKNITRAGKSKKDVSGCQLFIDGMTVFGHRLFGAPPTEPTYLCNWDFDIGDISGECSTEFVRILITAILAFVYTMDDDENALPKGEVEVIPDITFLRMRAAGLRTWIVAADTAFLLTVAATTVELNDWTNDHFSKYVKVSAPMILLAAVDSAIAYRYRESPEKKVPTFACVSSSVRLAVLDRKSDFSQNRRLQQQHVWFHDLRTQRAQWLLDRQRRLLEGNRNTAWARQPPAMPVPLMPIPINSAVKPNEDVRRKSSTFLTSSPFGLHEQQNIVIHKPSSQDHTDDILGTSRRVSAISAPHLTSSPWLKPRFQLRKVEPDLTYMPVIHMSRHIEDHQQDFDDDEFPITNEEYKHNGIFCDLVDGIGGFVTPDAVQSIVTLLNEVSPQRPESILDDLQIQVVSNIKKLTGAHVPQIDDLSFRLPTAHLRLISPHTASDMGIGFDQYDITLQHTRATIRLAPSTHVKSLKPFIMLHASTQEIAVEVAECNPEAEQFKSGAEILLSDLGLWLSLKEEVRARTQISSIDVTTAGQNLDSLAGLIQRSEAIVELALAQIRRVDFADRIQHMVYHLTSANDYQDPAFVSRAVNVLRTAEDHIRLHGSWKMMTRLRYILNNYQSQQAAAHQCQDNCLEEDEVQAKQHILAAFDKWRSWENAGEADDALLQAVFGPSKQSVAQPQSATDVEAEVLLGQAALTLDPGPHQSRMYVQSLDLNFAEKTLQSSSTAWSFGGQQRTAMVVQAYCGALGCVLDWELLNLAERVIHLSKSFEFGVSETDQSTTAPQRLALPMLTVVIGADAISLEARSPNLQLVTGLERLQLSANTDADEQRSNISVVLNANSGRLRLRNKRRSILGCKVNAPTIYVNTQLGESPENGKVMLHTAATCERFRLHLKEDVVGILHVVQSVMDTEMVDVHHLVQAVDTRTKSVKNDDVRSEVTRKQIEPHVALFLEDYVMQFDLMAYLRYKIAGKVARTSVIPMGSKLFTIRVDVKENNHFFENPGSSEKISKSYLTMPPLSATVCLAMLPDRVGIDVRAAVEAMHLEASAVRACFDAAYRPQTIDYVKQIQVLVARIRSRLAEDGLAQDDLSMMGHHTKPVALPIQYHGYLVFEGIRIRCRAPAMRKDQDYLVDLNIALDTLSLRAGNLKHSTKVIHQKPHFEVNLHSISIGIDRVTQWNETFGRLRTGLHLAAMTEVADDGNEVQNFRLTTSGINVDLYAETAVLAVDLMTFLQERIKTLAAAEDAKKLKPLRRFTMAATETRPLIPSKDVEDDQADDEATALLQSTFAVELKMICIRWLVNGSGKDSSGRAMEDMALTVTKIDLQTKREASARLSIKNLQLQLVPRGRDPFDRAPNSALLPEMVFNAAYARAKSTRKFAFKAAGKVLDVRLASNFILPAADVQRSLALASSELRTLKASVVTEEVGAPQAQLPKLLGNKRLAHLLVFVEFAGAEVTVSPAREVEQEETSAFGFLKGPKRSRAGRYGQAVQSSSGEDATLKAPGIAIQVEYSDHGIEDPTLSTEIRVAASSNTLTPSVVPLILEISSSVSSAIELDSGSPTQDNKSADNSQKPTNTRAMQQADPTAVLGRVKLNAGLLVQKQEFSLTCQPIARVSATARFEEIFVIINTVQAKDQERFFSVMTAFNNLEASVQHVYSRESTANFAVDSITVSLMNSKHFSDKSGISAILNVSPMKAYLNAKQMQDFLLFREIWYPAELRTEKPVSKPADSKDQFQGPIMQRFQEVTSTAVLPWQAIVSIQELIFQVDFGQSIGKSDFAIQKLWASSKKNSDSEQNLCIGFEKIGIESQGRMSGFVALQGFKVRTAIRWPMVDDKVQAPLVQGSIGFEHLRVKAVFDYQPFAVADVSFFEFLIYNVRQGRANDRLVGILDGGKIQAFCTTATAAQGLSIAQAFERLIQEKKEAFESSIHELDKYLRRKSAFPTANASNAASIGRLTRRSTKEEKTSHAPNLHVDMVITLRAIDAGVFMSSFFDDTVLKADAADVQARFAVGETDNKTHSGLGMSLGQVRLALSSVSRPNAKALGEVSVVDVIERATAARGGIILKVPRLVASMETWQEGLANVIEYVFSSTFQGKVDIGFNFARINTIRRMWESHSRALAQKTSKPMPQSAIKITAEPKTEAEGQEKITAVVHMPQSKYEYIPLEPPIIDTPQLRDLGEATPSLEWIGLHRERLPHVTHSIIIVSLLEVAKEIEDSYTRILGSS